MTYSSGFFAGDGNWYSGEPPEGWYLAEDGRWWAPDTGPPPLLRFGYGPKKWRGTARLRHYGNITLGRSGMARTMRGSSRGGKFIDYSMITSVAVVRRRWLKRDTVLVRAGEAILEIKVTGSAQSFVDELLRMIAAGKVPL